MRSPSTNLTRQAPDGGRGAPSRLLPAPLAPVQLAIEMAPQVYQPVWVRTRLAELRRKLSERPAADGEPALLDCDADDAKTAAQAAS